MLRSGGSKYEHTKRHMDAIIAALALIISMPILVVATILIKLDGGPVLFKQTRIGRNGKFFEMLKLRTMVPNAHKMESLLKKEHDAQGGYGIEGNYSDHRITKIGAVLRMLNMDELPQLINVIKGEMSLVGPRPVPYDESLLFGRRRKEILSVRPGLTGFWQIKRRMSMDYKERIMLDTFYARRRNLQLDMYIALMTPISMLISDYNSVSKPLPPSVDDVQPKKIVLLSQMNSSQVSSIETPSSNTYANK